MKNKFIILPIAIISLGVTSCNNNSWPTIDDTKLLEVSNKIKDSAAKIIEEFEKFSSITIDEKWTIVENSGRYLLTNQWFTNYYIDADGLYEKDHSYHNESKPAGTMVSTFDTYRLLKDKYEYNVNTYYFNGTKEEYETTEEQFKADLKITGKSHYLDTCENYYVKNANMSKTLEELKTNKKTTEELGNGSFYNFHFESDSDSNLRFVLDSKAINPKPDESKGEERIDYVSKKYDIICHNNIIDKVYSKIETKGKRNSFEFLDSEEIDTTFKFNEKIEHDNVDLNDYLIEEGY